MITVGAPVQKRLALAFVSLTLASSRFSTDALQASLIGGWVNAVLYRRPAMSLIYDLYKTPLSDVHETPRLIHLTRSMAQELLLLSVLCPFWVTDISAIPQSRCYSTDSSDSKGAVVSCPISAELATVLCRTGRKKTTYSRMLTREETLLRKLDWSREEFQDLPDGRRDEDPGPERPRAFRFHFIEVCGGAGRVSHFMRMYGWNVGPVIDIDRSPAYDFSLLRVLQWLAHLIENDLLGSFMVEPPCTTFSPAQYPASRSYTSPRGFDPNEPKTLLGTTLALRALSLMYFASTFEVPGLLEQPRRSKMRKLQEWQRLLNLKRASEVWTASCMWGSPHQKEFVFLVCCMDASNLHRKCDRSHDHIRIEGKWTKESATYTEELASGLAYSFDRALRRKMKALEIKASGLESPLCNEIILASRWSLEKVWRWKRPMHINIQEALAAERLFKQEAIIRPKTRFPVIMDSNVGLSALAKGRSPSRGLRNALRRAGSTLVVGCLYPSIHFGPTRILPADCPTRDHDFPEARDSFTQADINKASLLDFARVSGLRRFAANWVRLSLMLLGGIPPWFGSAESWRFAHVHPSRYPCAPRSQLGFNPLDFDATRGFFGEGPLFWGPLSGSEAGEHWTCSWLCSFLAVLLLYAGIQRQPRTLGVGMGPRRSPTKPGRSRSSSPMFPSVGLHGCGTPKWWFWLLMSCQLLGSTTAVSHGPKLIPRHQADLELPQGRPVLPATQKRRDFLLEQFASWLKGHDMSLDEILLTTTPDIEALNVMLEKYGRELYRSGRPYGHYSETLNAVSGRRLRVRRFLQPAWDVAYGWLRQEPPNHHLALPWQALLSLIATSWMWGWNRVAGVIALSWGGITRIGEVLAACRRDLILPSDVEGSINYALLQIAEPKTRFKCARHQIARLDHPQLLKTIEVAFQDLEPWQQLWPASPQTMRLRFNKLLKATGLDQLPDGISRGIDLGSLRAGGASWLLLSSEDSEMTRRRGRWITTKVMEIYVQEAWSVQFMPKLPRQVKQQIWNGAQLFPSALEYVTTWKAASIPESAWPLLFLNAARDFELNIMGVKKMGGVAPLFPRGVCAPPFTAERNKSLRD